jgi:hypothetical protein
MNTDELITSLAANVRPVGRGAVGWRLASGVMAGALASTLLIVATLGPRPDLWLAMHGGTFWMKWGYTISLGPPRAARSGQSAPSVADRRAGAGPGGGLRR